MKAVLGRLSDLGLAELLKLLTSVGVEGVLELANAAGTARVAVRDGSVSADAGSVLALAARRRTGTFRFEPGPVMGGEWIGVDQLLAAVAQAEDEPVVAAAGTAGDDPLEELRGSLEALPLGVGAVRVSVVSGDPRPYRAVEGEWARRGWMVSLAPEPSWGEGPPPGLLILHLPGAATLAGQGARWLELARRAAAANPPVPVLWVGGLSDPWLRHQAILAGVEFLLPAPLQEVGEAARWFREELTLLVERALARRQAAGGEAEAFREVFLALHSDLEPAALRASLLRFAASYFERGLLLAVRESGFESLGAYGFAPAPPQRLARGIGLLEDVVLTRAPVRVDEARPGEVRALLTVLRLPDGLDHAGLYPLLEGGECVGAFLGDRPVGQEMSDQTVAALLARAGGLLGL